MFLFCILGADETVSVTFVYPGNRVFAFVCSLACNLAQTGIIQGTKGIIEVYTMCTCTASMSSIREYTSMFILFERHICEHRVQDKIIMARPR